MTTSITLGMLMVYIAIMMGIGLYTSRKTKSVSDFVLGGRNVGSWLTAFAYGTSYFSAVVSHMSVFIIPLNILVFSVAFPSPSKIK